MYTRNNVQILHIIKWFSNGFHCNMQGLSVMSGSKSDETYENVYCAVWKRTECICINECKENTRELDVNALYTCLFIAYRCWQNCLNDCTQLQRAYKMETNMYHVGYCRCVWMLKWMRPHLHTGTEGDDCEYTAYCFAERRCTIAAPRSALDLVEAWLKLMGISTHLMLATMLHLGNG